MSNPSNEAVPKAFASAFSRQAVADAMQSAWDEICADTGCHPLDIRHEGKKLLFSPGHWAALTAKLLFVNAVTESLAVLPKPTPEELAAINAKVAAGFGWEYPV